MQAPEFQRLAFRVLFAVQGIHQFDGLLLQFHHDAVDPADKIAVHHQCRDGHRKPGGGGNQGLGNTARKGTGIASALGHDFSEHRDHTEHRAEQAEQGRHRSYGAQCIEVAFEIVDHVTGGFLDTLFHNVAAVVGIAQTCREYPAQRRCFLQVAQSLRIEFPGLELFPDGGQQVRRRNLPRIQGVKTLHTNRQADDRAQQDGHHHPAAGNEQLEHVIPPRYCSGAIIRTGPRCKKPGYIQNRRSSCRRLVMRTGWPGTNSYSRAPPVAVSCTMAPMRRNLSTTSPWGWPNRLA